MRQRVAVCQRGVPVLLHAEERQSTERMALVPIGHELDDELAVVQRGVRAVYPCAERAAGREQLNVVWQAGDGLGVELQRLHQRTMLDRPLRLMDEPSGNSLVSGLLDTACRACRGRLGQRGSRLRVLLVVRAGRLGGGGGALLHVRVQVLLGALRRACRVDVHVVELNHRWS